MMINKIVAATNNEGKLRELREIFACYGVECLSLAQAGLKSDPDEAGKSFVQNALIKARAVKCPYPLLADDSGLCVRALGGAPGINTARYAGEPVSSERNIKKLLDAMKDVSDRTAHFYCCCVLVFPDGREVIANGMVHGTVAEHVLARGGFGYDPVFVLRDGRCIAAIPEAEKNALSHRGRAIKNLMKKIGVTQNA